MRRMAVILLGVWLVMASVPIQAQVSSLTLSASASVVSKDTRSSNVSTGFFDTLFNNVSQLISNIGTSVSNVVGGMVSAVSNWVEPAKPAAPVVVDSKVRGAVAPEQLAAQLPFQTPTASVPTDSKVRAESVLPVEGVNELEPAAPAAPVAPTMGGAAIAPQKMDPLRLADVNINARAPMVKSNAPSSANSSSNASNAANASPSSPTNSASPVESVDRSAVAAPSSVAESPSPRVSDTANRSKSVEVVQPESANTVARQEGSTSAPSTSRSEITAAGSYTPLYVAPQPQTFATRESPAPAPRVETRETAPVEERRTIAEAPRAVEPTRESSEEEAALLERRRLAAEAQEAEELAMVMERRRLMAQAQEQVQTSSEETRVVAESREQVTTEASAESREVVAANAELELERRRLEAMAEALPVLDIPQAVRLNTQAATISDEIIANTQAGAAELTIGDGLSGLTAKVEEEKLFVQEGAGDADKLLGKIQGKFQEKMEIAGEPIGDRYKSKIFDIASAKKITISVDNAPTKMAATLVEGKKFEQLVILSDGGKVVILNPNDPNLPVLSCSGGSNKPGDESVFMTVGRDDNGTQALLVGSAKEVQVVYHPYKVLKQLDADAWVPLMKADQAKEVDCGALIPADAKFKLPEPMDGEKKLKYGEGEQTGDKVVVFVEEANSKLVTGVAVLSFGSSPADFKSHILALPEKNKFNSNAFAVKEMAASFSGDKLSISALVAANNKVSHKLDCSGVEALVCEQSTEVPAAAEDVIIEKKVKEKAKLSINKASQEKKEEFVSEVAKKGKELGDVQVSFDGFEKFGDIPNAVVTRDDLLTGMLRKLPDGVGLDPDEIYPVGNLSVPVDINNYGGKDLLIMKFSPQGFFFTVMGNINEAPVIEKVAAKEESAGLLRLEPTLSTEQDEELSLTWSLKEKVGDALVDRSDALSDIHAENPTVDLTKLQPKAPESSGELNVNVNAGVSKSLKSVASAEPTVYLAKLTVTDPAGLQATSDAEFNISAKGVTVVVKDKSTAEGINSNGSNTSGSKDGSDANGKPGSGDGSGLDAQIEASQSATSVSGLEGCSLSTYSTSTLPMGFLFLFIPLLAFVPARISRRR